MAHSHTQASDTNAYTTRDPCHSGIHTEDVRGA